MPALNHLDYISMVRFQLLYIFEGTVDTVPSLFSLTGRSFARFCST